MKKKVMVICIVLCIFIVGGVAAVLSVIPKEPARKIVMVEDLDLEEGCYGRLNNDDKIDHDIPYLCVTKEPEIFHVLYLDGVYYNDLYYLKTPPTEDHQVLYESTIDDLILTERYYSNHEQYAFDTCHSENKNKLVCTYKAYDSSLPSDSQKYTYVKINKDFDKKSIKELPVYERNKAYDIDFDGTIINCNLTRNYSIIKMGSSSEVSKCLSKYFNEEYSIAELDDSGNWIIATKSEWNDGIPTVSSSASIIDAYINGYQTLPAKEARADYLKKNKAYKVTVNDKTFNFAQAFPIDPYTTDEKMVVKIVKQ